jgi:two-component system chemotaxis sensor kinase CheA
VDRLAGELQAVIKPLGAIFRHLQGIGGSTILGSGEVALILDISALIKISGQAEQRLLARPNNVAPDFLHHPENKHV